MSDDSTLLPCPMCGDDSVGYYYDEDENERELCSICCRNCQFETKQFRSEKMAEHTWNTMPRNLKWTKEPPTKEGWYWHHVNPSFGTVIEFFDPELSDGKFHEGDDWAGPIPMPVE